MCCLSPELRDFYLKWQIVARWLANDVIVASWSTSRLNVEVHMLLRMQYKQSATLCLVLGMSVFAGCVFSQAQAIDTTTGTNALTDAPIKVKAKNVMSDNEESQLVPISAITFDGNKISAGVVSFGCTTSADFAVEHAVVNGVCEVKINRVNRDVCRRAPFVADIELEWSQPEECSDLKIVVANPLLVTGDGDEFVKKMK